MKDLESIKIEDLELKNDLKMDDGTIIPAGSILINVRIIGDMFHGNWKTSSKEWNNCMHSFEGNDLELFKKYTYNELEDLIL
jgi:hypothetical protein